MTANSPTTPPSNSNQVRNLLIAIAAIVLAAVFALGLKSQANSASLPAMAKASVPLEVALQNGKPTLMEFYADWCSSCQHMAPTLADLKRQYGDRVNFVMLNVDNEKWLPEIVSYRVDGIPHFVYLNGAQESVAQAIGEQPASVMGANLLALAAGAELPMTTAQGQTSDYQPPAVTQGTSSGNQSNNKSTRSDDPRAHGVQVKG
jgi:thiol-disulfide isomerase/thioredoxin